MILLEVVNPFDFIDPLTELLLDEALEEALSEASEESAGQVAGLGPDVLSKLGEAIAENPLLQERLKNIDF